MANFNTKLKTSNYKPSFPPKLYSPVRENTETKHHKDNQSKGKPKANEHTYLSIILAIFYPIRLANTRYSQDPMYRPGCGKTEK